MFGFCLVGHPAKLSHGSLLFDLVVSSSDSLLFSWRKELALAINFAAVSCATRGPKTALLKASYAL
jgi:hypothetical protein